MNRTFIQSKLNKSLIKIIISGPRKKDTHFKKIIVKPYQQKEKLMFQFESFTEKQAFHDNYDTDAALDMLTELIQGNEYKHIDGFMTDSEWHALFSKKGKSTIRENITDTKRKVTLDHNRQKTYLIEEGIPVPYLVALGVMTEDGRVTKKRYDKFRQINRFLEMVEDIESSLPKDRPLRIIDFGCGRSYLTFAIYHYFTELKKREVQILGLDLKEQVIKDCNKLADKCGYSGLSFEHGDIVDYKSTSDIDMVVTLHACDTATDLAIKKAVNWNAKVILSVPCCQHELNGQIRINAISDLLSYGIIKERMAALMTDAMRAEWLKLQGYQVQILEFIDVAHTPKNLLIRATKVKDVPSTDVDYTHFDLLQKQLNSDLSIRH